MVPSTRKAFEALEMVEVDIAILDIHLKGGKVYPFAEHLAERAIPFVFVTGYGEDPELPERLANVPKLEKPVDSDRLLDVLRTLVKDLATDERR
jgi:two-component SAPR family response regulator